MKFKGFCVDKSKNENSGEIDSQVFIFDYFFGLEQHFSAEILKINLGSLLSVSRLEIRSSQGHVLKFFQIVWPS